MQIRTELFMIKREKGLISVQSVLDVVKSIENEKTVLRWGIINVTDSAIVLEAAITDSMRNNVWQLPQFGMTSGCQVALVVPTGVGAAFGGFIGDIGPVVKVSTFAVTDIL